MQLRTQPVWGDLLTSMIYAFLCTLSWSNTREEQMTVPAPAPFLSPLNNWFIEAIRARAPDDSVFL